MRTDKIRELRKIARIDTTRKKGSQYLLIGFYVTGSSKIHFTRKQCLRYAKSKGWKVINPLKIQERP